MTDKGLRGEGPRLQKVLQRVHELSYEMFYKKALRKINGFCPATGVRCMRQRGLVRTIAPWAGISHLAVLQ
ncbi:protein of unknown function (plasmid) [Caballeronia sp. S22]